MKSISPIKTKVLTKTQKTSSKVESKDYYSSEDSLIIETLRALQPEEKSLIAGSDVTEHKVVRLTPPPSLLLMMRSVFQPGKVFRFRMTRNATLTTSGAGSLNLATKVYPSQFDQYSAISLIFDECRLRGTRISLVDVQINGNTNLSSAIASVFDPSEAMVSPTFTACTRQPGCKVYTTTQKNWPVRNVWKSKTLRPWSIVSTTSTGVDPVGGIIGQWAHCAQTTLSNSIGYLSYLIEVDYEFRNPV